MKKDVGQFWLVENGEIFKITQTPTATNSCFVGNRLEKDGCFAEQVGVSESNFESHIEPELARKMANEIMRLKVNTFFF